MFNHLFVKKGESDNASQHEWETEGSGVIEIEEIDNKDAVSSKSEKKAHHTNHTSASKLSLAASLKDSRRQIQREYANLFLTDWLHENMAGDNDCPENVEEWGDHGNLKLIAGKEEYHKNVTEADNMDAWLRSSPLWRRFLLQWPAVLVLFLIMHVVGFILTASHVKFDKDPFICDTRSCHKITKWLNSAINYSVDPCDNFYQFVCGNYNNKQEAEDTYDYKQGIFSVFKNLRSDIQQRLIYGKILRNNNDSYVFHQVRLVYKSCLNYTARDEQGVSDFVQVLNDIGLHPENSSSDVNHIAFDVWRYTGEIALFELTLYINPYDGLRKYVATPGSSYHSHVTGEDFGGHTYAFQQINSVMNITKYSAEEMAKAFRLILDALSKAMFASGEEDISLWDTDPGPFLCDDFLNKLDDRIGPINSNTFYLNKDVPLSSQDRNFKFALFICNGGLNHIVNAGVTPNINAALSYKAYWIMWMFFKHYGILNPAFKSRSKFNTAFPKVTDTRGSECLRAVQSTLPHIVHERLMKTYNISDKEMAHVEKQYYFTKRSFQAWLYDDQNKESFGSDTINAYREGINAGYKLENARFSLSDLERLGYGESAKKISETHFIKNMLILNQVLSDNELKRWRMENGYWLPVPHHVFKFIIKEVVSTIYQTRPRLYHPSLIPAHLYTSLYSSKDLLPLDFGGIRTFFMADIVYRWNHYVKFRYLQGSIQLDPVDTLPCEVINKNKKTGIETTTVDRHRSWYLPWHLMFDILLEMFKLERQYNNGTKRFQYRKLIGFEKYSEEQLIFMKMIRHQCASEIKTFDKSEILTGLANSDTFQNTWNCPADSFMNVEHKCYQGKIKLSDNTKFRLQLERTGGINEFSWRQDDLRHKRWKTDIRKMGAPWFSVNRTKFNIQPT